MLQNEQLLRTQMAYEESNRYAQIEVAMLGEEPSIAWAKSLVDPGSLDLREQRVIEAYIWLAVEQWRSAYDVSELGLTRDEWRVRVVRDSNYFLNSVYGRAVWKYMKESVPREVADFVDELLETVSFNPLEFQQQIMRDVKAELAQTEAAAND